MLTWGAAAFTAVRMIEGVQEIKVTAEMAFTFCCKRCIFCPIICSSTYHFYLPCWKPENGNRNLTGRFDAVAPLISNETKSNLSKNSWWSRVSFPQSKTKTIQQEEPNKKVRNVAFTRMEDGVEIDASRLIMSSTKAKTLERFYLTENNPGVKSCNEGKSNLKVQTDEHICYLIWRTKIKETTTLLHTLLKRISRLLRCIIPSLRVHLHLLFVRVTYSQHNIWGNQEGNATALSKNVVSGIEDSNYLVKLS